MTSAAGSFIGEIGKQYVMPTLLAKYPNYSRGISMSVSPVLSEVATSAILYPSLSPDDLSMGLVKSFALGGLSNIGGDYAYNTLFGKSF